ncbi:MAG: 1-(5-phosphoribosyl)-5-[(5-phosphoribosylamino)methylideneamino]imidazole-4-carboxamide isomerase [Gammaproteobacteria bacterium]|nr:1-(5-phosphoribosyl)-5-[(5-phosphoribosylamino)methylideneamino]imidazole-4-carboxamide isomerase [Gammaproteobacteria bacterium]NNC56245.1 1-(5-phosphoribosyl)-5-[(5-phosphoribosylamino)methylideneamino]imidazole-4-carboxamide isomerase [Woeseiaceae bacterium]
MRLIPAIDLKGGKCVRLFKGDFDRTTEYSNDPVAVGRRFSGLDVQDLHIVDLDGARSGEQHNRTIVRAIAAETGLHIQLGGGIRDRSTVADWLGNGVARVVIGSMAITEVPTVREWLHEFGADRIVLALDVNIAKDGTPMLTTHGWTREAGVSLWECIDSYSDAGVEQVLCTDVSRDGAMAGPNIELYVETLRRYPDLQLQASGGVRNIDDLQQLRSRGIPAAISGRALLDGAITTTEVASFRRSA